MSEPHAQVPPPPIDGDDSYRLQFRVVAIAGARRAFRLESIFWKTLEVLARRHGRSLASEIEARLKDVPADLNQSSVLRARLADDLFQLWTAAEARAPAQKWSNLIAAMPTPAFLINANSVLLSVNEPLMSALQAQHAQPGPRLDTVAGALGLTVEVPPAAIMELTAQPDRRFVACTASFIAAGQRVTSRIRLMPVETGGSSPALFVGFLGRPVN